LFILYTCSGWTGWIEPVQQWRWGHRRLAKYWGLRFAVEASLGVPPRNHAESALEKYQSTE
jgi:hypothetical protein